MASVVVHVRAARHSGGGVVVGDIVRVAITACTVIGLARITETTGNGNRGSRR